MGYELNVWERICTRYAILLRLQSLIHWDLFFRIGAEAKGLGIHVQLGPVGGPLGKIPAVRHHGIDCLENTEVGPGRPQLGRIFE